jgi:hypothetical protein
MNNLNKLLKVEHIIGLTIVQFEKNRICSASQAGKQVSAPHPSKNVLTTTRPSKLFHMDIFGPVSYVSIGRNKYGFIIIDDYSRHTLVLFMRDNNKVHEIFKKFALIAPNKFEVKIKRMRSDNDTEFKNTNIEEFLDEEGIGHEFSVPNTPQQNGIMERKKMILIEVARTMLDEYKTSDSFWVEAINTACHAINCLYLHKLRHKTTYKLLTGKKPIVSYFRVFGSKCFILNKKPKSSKFAPKFGEGIFLGYASNAHGYRDLNKTTSCVDVTCDVTFDESNGSQVEQVDDLCVGKENSSPDAIKKMSIKEIKPQEDEDYDIIEDSPSVSVPAKLRDSRQNPGDFRDLSGNTRPSNYDAQNNQEKEDLIQQVASDPHPRVHQSIRREHPVDNIVGSIRRGVTSPSRLEIFCEHYSFISMLEPLRVEEALEDPD